MYIFITACSLLQNCKTDMLGHLCPPHSKKPSWLTWLVRKMQSNGVKYSRKSLKTLNFEGIDTMDRVLKCDRMGMKQLYRETFDRNSETILEQRVQYVQVGVFLYKIYVFFHIESVSTGFPRMTT